MSKLPKILITRTPFIRIFALAIYIVFPILGFYFGIWYQKHQKPTSQLITANFNASPTDKISELNKWKTYQNELFGFSFSYPAPFAIKVDSKISHSLSIKIVGDPKDFCLQNPNEVCTKLFEDNKKSSLFELNIDKGAFDIKSSLISLKKNATMGHLVDTNPFKGDFIREGLYHSDITINPYFNLYYWEYSDPLRDYTYSFKSSIPLSHNSDAFKLVNSLKILGGFSPIKRPLPKTIFSGCNNLTAFNDKIWYKNFFQLLNQSGVTTDNITQACLSNNESLLVFMRSGAYCIGPRIAQYLINENKFDEATTDGPEGCLSGSDKFESANGSVFTIKGWGGDAGCGSEDYYSYDTSTNIIKMTKSYSGCEGDSGYKWTYY